MLVRQLSVFVENKTGSLSEITSVLAGHNINIYAFCVADTTKFGILRMIVNNPDEALKLLLDANFTASMTKIAAVPHADRVGGLNEVLLLLKEVNVSVEYVYSFISKPSGKAVALICMDDNAGGAKHLIERGVHVLSEDELMSI